MEKIVRRLKLYAHSWWYLPLISFLSALDAYIIIVPNEALLLPAVLARPRRWVFTVFWFTLGSAVGATSFAMLSGIYGSKLIEHILPGSFQSKTWINSLAYIHHYSEWGLTLISLSPLPQHPAVAIAGLAHLPLITIFIAVFLGRSLKYLLVAGCGLWGKKLIRRHFTTPRLKSDR